MQSNSTFWRSPVLAIRDFRVLISTRGLLQFGLQIQAVIVGWQIYQLRHEALLLGMIGLAEALPAIGGALVAGHLVDIARPTRVLNLSLALLALNSLFLFIAVNPNNGFSGDLQLWTLFLGVFISGAGRSFVSPAAFSILPQIVPKERIPQAAAMNSSFFTMAQILGPAIGGLAYSAFGPLATFAIPLVLISIAFLNSFRWSTAAKKYQSQHVKEPMFRSIKAGWSFLWNHPVLLSTMMLDMLSVLFGGAVAVLPIFADQVFHVGSSGLGVLRAAPAVGSVLISIFLAWRPLPVTSGRQLLTVIAGFGACMVGFALVNNFYMALVFLAFSGVFDGVNMIIRGTITQLLTPDQMRGRVSSLASVFITSSNEIGAFESGLAATALGLIPSVVFGGVMTLLIVAVIAWRTPELRRTEIRH